LHLIIQQQNLTWKQKKLQKNWFACCRTADWSGAQNELYDTNAISIEPYATPEFPKETTGLKAIGEKGKSLT